MGGGVWDMALLDLVRKTLLMQWPYMFEICLFAFCLGAAMRVRSLPHFSWLHHLVLVFLTGFGGGTIVPMFFGRPPAIFTNDLIVPLVFIAWYLVHYTPVGPNLQFSAAKYLLVFLFEIYRASSILKVVSQTAQDIPAGPYYPIPLIGPILVGTLSGSMGAFMPLDRGLFFIQSGFPLNLQITFLACSFFHIAQHDPHLIGAFLRGTPFLDLADTDNLKATLVAFFVSMAFCSLLMGPDFNPFERFHRILYDITGLPVSPATEERIKLRKAAEAAAAGANGSGSSDTSPTNGRKPFTTITRAVELSKVLVPVLAILISLYKLTTPKAPKLRLGLDEKLYPGEFIAACGLRDRDCKQHYLTIDPHDGQLSLYRGISPADPASERVWQGKHKRRTGQLQPTGFYAQLDDEGNLNLKHQDCSKTYWNNAVKAKTATENIDTEGGPKEVRVLDRGAWGIFEGEQPIWTSDQQTTLLAWGK